MIVIVTIIEKINVQISEQGWTNFIPSNDELKINKEGIKNKPCLDIANRLALTDFPMVWLIIFAGENMPSVGKVKQWSFNVDTPTFKNKSISLILSDSLQNNRTKSSAKI